MTIKRSIKRFLNMALIGSFLCITSCNEEEINRDTEPLTDQTNSTNNITNENTVTNKEETPKQPAPSSPINEKPNTPPKEEVIIVEEKPIPVAPQPITKEASEAQKILRLVNQERTSRGLKPVKLNTALNEAAFKHSKDMNDNNYFSHTGLNGSTFGQRAKEASYAGFPRGENIANGYRNAQDVHNGWMQSSGHRQNILTPGVTEMGLGRSGNLWTQIFGVSR